MRILDDGEKIKYVDNDDNVNIHFTEEPSTYQFTNIINQKGICNMSKIKNNKGEINNEPQRFTRRSCQ